MELPTQRFDPLRNPTEIEDDSSQSPETHWRPGHIPDPERLLLAKEKMQQGEARYRTLSERLADDSLAQILIDVAYERDEAQAEAVRRRHVATQINDARRRLPRHLAGIVTEEERKR